MPDVVSAIRRNPDSRRLIVTAWNPADLDKMALPPCHCLFQFYVAEGPALLPALPALGRCLPRRAVQHRLLCAAHADGGAGDGIEAGEFVHTLGDAHLYLDHLEQARLQLSRLPRRLPKMVLNPAVTDLFAFRYEDFSLEGYDPHPHIKAKVAV